MGVIYFKLGRYEESLAAYNQAFLMMLEYHDALKNRPLIWIYIIKIVMKY